MNELQVIYYKKSMVIDLQIPWTVMKRRLSDVLVVMPVSIHIALYIFHFVEIAIFLSKPLRDNAEQDI